MPQEQPVYITSRQLRDRYGGVSHMWIERRLAEDSEFPKPVFFGKRRFWPLARLEAYERAKARGQAA
jgi:hypothetical protein